MKSYLNKEGPESSMTVIKADLDTDICTGRNPLNNLGIEGGDAAEAKEHQRLPENYQTRSKA
jgi:hypothetical protein